jgi:exodeoxyribonuclease V alpha subunit
MLRSGRRFDGAIGELARAVNRGDAAVATALLRTAPAGALHELESPTPAAVVALALHGRAGAGGGLRDYCELLRQRPPQAEDFEAWASGVLAAAECSRLLCAVRAGDWGTQALNAAIERALAQQGWLDLQPARGPWYEGRLVIVTRNDPGAGVSNGDVGVVLAAPGAGGPGTALRAWFAAGAALRSVGVARLADVETAFAMTVHKAQGSEFEHAVLVLPREPSRVASRELVYTAVTRARSAFTLASGRDGALAEALARRTLRASGLAEQLDTAADSSAVHGRR